MSDSPQKSLPAGRQARNPWLRFLVETRPAGAAVILAAIALLAGCETTSMQTRQQRDQQWRDDVTDQIAELNRSVELVRSQQSALDRRLNSLETSFRSVAESQRALSSLRSEMATLKAAMDSKISLVVDEVARENERLLSKMKTSQKASYAQGYEHAVGPGETLSDIARQYKTTVKAILEANQLSDANSLRVGQKLFIPQ